MSHAQSQLEPVAQEAIEALRRALPYLEALVRCADALAGELEITMEHCPCDSCPRQATCRKPCELLEAHLPGKHSGRGHRENLIGLFPETLQGVHRTRQTDLFGGFQSCQHIFTGKQWQCITLYYRDGKNQKEIAEETGKKRSSVSDLLRRARNRKEQYVKDLRQEHVRFLNASDVE